MTDRAPLRLAYAGDPALLLQEPLGVLAVELTRGADECRGTGRRPAGTAITCLNGQTARPRLYSIELSEGWDRRER